MVRNDSVDSSGRMDDGATCSLDKNQPRIRRNIGNTVHTRDETTSFLAPVVVVSYTCCRHVEKIPDVRTRILEIPTAAAAATTFRADCPRTRYTPPLASSAAVVVAAETNDESLQENTNAHAHTHARTTIGRARKRYYNYTGGEYRRSASSSSSCVPSKY